MTINQNGGDVKEQLRRTQIRRILLKHRGSIQRLADSLGITQQAVSMWLLGKTPSARVAKAALNEALRLRDGGRNTA